MKKVCFVLVLILTLVMLCSCGGYVKSYSATILITSCQGDEASIGVLSAKIYRVGVLLYGTPPKIGTILKTVFKKQ